MTKMWTALALGTLLALPVAATATETAKPTPAASVIRGQWGYCSYNCYNATTQTLTHYWPMGPMTQSDCCGGAQVICPSGSSPAGLVAWAPEGGALSICQDF
ncbi:MAG TPA: hypothetical protein VMM92_04235 [Thermoanaerobaculia bacterium]|nr:hypothetical protein [Thermoanaerobaculia bacterium]